MINLITNAVANLGAVPGLKAGLLANRPSAASSKNVWYYSTDAGSESLAISDGANWNVIAQAGSSVTAGSGLTMDGNAIDLGGELTGNATIIGNGNQFNVFGVDYGNLSAGNSGNESALTVEPSGVTMNSQAIGSPDVAEIGAEAVNAYISASNATNQRFIELYTFSDPSGGGFILEDQIDNIGLTEASDYSANKQPNSYITPNYLQVAKVPIKSSGGLSSFSDGVQGFYVGPFTGGGGYGAIYPYGITPSGSNWVFAATVDVTDIRAGANINFVFDIALPPVLVISPPGIQVNGTGSFTGNVTAPNIVTKDNTTTVVANGGLTGQTGAGIAVTYAVPAGSVETFLISFYINYTAYTSGQAFPYVSFTDENGNAQEPSLSTLVTAGEGVYIAASTIIRVSPGTEITIGTSPTGAFTYNCWATIMLMPTI